MRAEDKGQENGCKAVHVEAGWVRPFNAPTRKPVRMHRTRFISTNLFAYP
jgi:hypothetical protein